MGEGDAGGSNLVRVGRDLRVCGQIVLVRLELPVWRALEELCARENTTLEVVVSGLEQTRGSISLAAAIHAHITRYFKAAADQDRPRRGLSESERVDSAQSGPLAAALDVIGPAPKP